ncbi:hypothetical protein COB52_05420 [Candidatus Kaiserbacteria bacterium]|nr:MAG: hypothetical protein COB52_05420 [Candidatus Kaiserbacteria bacterium]
MKKISSFILLALLLSGANASADAFCGMGTHFCVNPADGSLAIINKKAVRFCTINRNLEREELLAKLVFYTRCSSVGGVVEIGAINK